MREAGDRNQQRDNNQQDNSFLRFVNPFRFFSFPIHHSQPRATTGCSASTIQASTSGSPRIARFSFLRHSAVRYSSICGLILLVSSPVLAADTYTPPPAFDPWLANVFYAVALVTALVALAKMLFPKRQPSVEAEFCTKKEQAEHCAQHHERFTEWRTENRAQSANTINSIEYLRKDLFKALADINAKGESRVSDVHDRINPLAESIASVRSTVENHLQDHRAKRV